MILPAKRRKLVTCRTVSFSTLERFCKLAKERPEVLEFNRQGQYRASQDLWSRMGASSWGRTNGDTLRSEGIQGGCGDASLAKAVGSSVAAGPVQARRAVGIDPVRG